MAVEVDPLYQEAVDKWRTRPTDIHKPQSLASRLFCRFLHFLVFEYIAIREFVRAVLSIFTQIVKRVWTMVTGRMRLPHEYVIRRFTRFPSHMVLAIEANPPTGFHLLNVDKMLAAAADLVSWCSFVGIPYVTLYDHGGMLRNHATEVQQLIEHHRSTIAKTHHLRMQRVVKMVDGEWTKNHLMQSDAEKKDTVYVQLLSSRDGREDLAEACRRLAERGMDSKKEITSADFEEQLQANHGFPCPDVMILWGETKSPLGFLPWHVHLTEIIRIPKYIQMGYETVHEVLSRFNKCEVRLGA